MNEAPQPTTLPHTSGHAAVEPICLAVIAADGRVDSVNAAWQAHEAQQDCGGRPASAVDAAKAASISAAGWPWPAAVVGTNYPLACAAAGDRGSQPAMLLGGALREVLAGGVDEREVVAAIPPTPAGVGEARMTIRALAGPSPRGAVLAWVPLDSRAPALPLPQPLLAELVDGIVDFAIFVLDPEGRILTWNRGAQLLLGWCRQEVVGRPFAMLFSADDQAQGLPERELAQAREGLYRGEGMRVRRDGTQLFAFSSLAAMRSPEGRLLGFAKVIGDMTALRRTEGELGRVVGELQQRNKELEQFVYTVSHDLKTPLVTISGFTSHLKDDLHQGRLERLPGFVDRVSAASDRMKCTIDDLLKLSRVGRVSAEHEPIDAARVVAAVVAEMAELFAARGATAVVRSPSAVIHADPAAFRVVVENLLSNALKYGCPRPGMEISIACLPVEDRVQFSVQDHGPGVPPDAAERVFGLFQRLSNKSEGTGVGLAIVKRIAEVHDGDAWLEETPGGGATVLVSLPARPDSPSSRRLSRSARLHGALQ